MTAALSRTGIRAGRELGNESFDPKVMMDRVVLAIESWEWDPRRRREARHATEQLLKAPAAECGTLQQWWEVVEPELIQHSPDRGRALLMGRFVRPSWAMAAAVRIETWTRALPSEDPLRQARERLIVACGQISWASPKGRLRAVRTALRLMVVCGYDSLSELTDDDLRIPGKGANGTDILDAALCLLGVFDRSPRRGTTRHKARPPRPIPELVRARVPEPFQAVTAAYMNAYSQRISANYSTVRTKIRSLAYFWKYLREEHPEVTECRNVLPHHARGFVPWALATARSVQRSTATKGTADRTTSYDWLVDVRSFFTDLCTWGTEPGSDLAGDMPSVVPLTTHDLNDGGFAAARARTTARMTATVMDLSREIPNIRAFALRRWHEGAQQLKARPSERKAVRAERDRFWDWALLELLLTSGLRVEEACELTTLDVLKRHLPDGRVYYMLHIKPSKYDRARVIPIGDGLGRVIAEIIAHVKGFYHSDAVPPCDRRDESAKVPLPTAPYLLQGAGHPSAMSIQTLRQRLQALSVEAGAQHADGTPLRLSPHDWQARLRH